MPRDADRPTAAPQHPPTYGLLATLGLLGLMTLALLLGCSEALGDHAPPPADDEAAQRDAPPRQTHVELIVAPDRRAGTLAAEPARFAQQLRNQLGRSLRVSGEVEARGPWTIEVAVLDASVRQQLAGTHFTTHQTQAWREIHNPELDDLRRALGRAAEHKSYWESLAREHWEAYHWLVEKHKETGEAQWKQMQPKYYTQAGRSEERMHDARRAFRDAKHALECAPRWITVAEPVTHRVRVETHRQTGTVTATFTLLDGEGVILEQQTLEATRVEEDQTIPRQHFGRGGFDLPDDPLVLTDGRRVIEALIGEVAEEAATHVRAAAR